MCYVKILIYLIKSQKHSLFFQSLAMTKNMFSKFHKIIECQKINSSIFIPQSNHQIYCFNLHSDYALLIKMN